MVKFGYISSLMQYRIMCITLKSIFSYSKQTQVYIRRHRSKWHHQRSDISHRMMFHVYVLNFNRSLERTSHKIPTVKELNPIFSNPKYFIVLLKPRADTGPWCIKVAKCSQLITTLNTLMGKKL